MTLQIAWCYHDAGCRCRCEVEERCEVHASGLELTAILLGQSLRWPLELGYVTYMLRAGPRMLGLEHSTCNPAGHHATNAASVCASEGIKVT